MSTGKIERIFQDEFEPTDQQLILGCSRVYVPFSKLPESKKLVYIYTGQEDIPFKERYPVYQELFLFEFLPYEKSLIKCVS
jgi:hypothetical protein